jgi:hypothetical protein
MEYWVLGKGIQCQSHTVCQPILSHRPWSEKSAGLQHTVNHTPKTDKPDPCSAPQALVVSLGTCQRQMHLRKVQHVPETRATCEGSVVRMGQDIRQGGKDDLLLEGRKGFHGVEKG